MEKAIAPLVDRCDGVVPGGVTEAGWAGASSVHAPFGSRVAARLTGNAFVLAAGVVAAVPVIVTTAQAIGARWTPSSDDGMIALRAFDVLSAHSPLVGQYSQTSALTGHATYSFGPMLYWVLAIPARLGGTAMVLTMGALSTACVMGVVALAKRRGGLALAIASAVAMVALSRSLPVEVPYEVWNCWAGLYPFTLLLFVTWSVACGEYRLTPLLVLVASYVIQVHFAYLVPATCTLVVAVAGLVVWLRRESAGKGVRRWAIAALVVGLVCWSAPVADQLAHRPGNFVRAFQVATNHHSKIGVGQTWYAPARAIGVVPWWAERSRTPVERFLEPGTKPPALTIVTAILVVAGLAVALVAALRRRRHDLAAAAVLALLLCLAMLVFQASVPRGLLGLTAFGYAITWMWPAGMFVWLTLGWSVWVFSSVVRRRVDLAALDLGGVAAVASLALVAAASAVVTDRWDENVGWRLPPGLEDYRLIRATTARVRDAFAHSRGVRIQVPRTVTNSLTFQSGIAYVLRREGVPVALPPRLVKEAGSYYRATSAPYQDILTISDGNAPIPPGGQVVVRVPQVTVTRSRAPAGTRPASVSP